MPTSRSAEAAGLAPVPAGRPWPTDTEYLDVRRRGAIWRATWRVAQPCPDCGALAMLVTGPPTAAIAECVACGAEHLAVHVLDPWIAWAREQNERARIGAGVAVHGTRPSAAA